MSSLPDDGQIRRIARDIFDRGEFNPQVSWLEKKWLEIQSALLDRWTEWLRRRLENWTGVSPDQELLDTISYLAMALVAIIAAVALFVVWQQLRKRFNLFKPFNPAAVSSTDKPGLLQQANAAAAGGDYAMACTLLFKAVLAGLRQEGYDIPFNNHSTRWIMWELEQLRYPRLSLMRGFCAEFNYICYYLGHPDESQWKSFLRQSELLTKPGETS